MNKELIMVFLPAFSWLLFSLGGTQISDKVKGWKGWRRFILPAIYIAAIILMGKWWLWALLTGASFGFAYSLGYGEKKSWFDRALVMIVYGACSAWIGISWWNLVTPVACFLLFLASNTKVTSHMFMWKICEGFFGLFCGIQIAYGLM